MEVSETVYLSVTTKTEGMYLALFDERSPANTKNRWNDSWRSAKENSKLESYKQIFFFNEIWADYAKSNHLLAWVLNFDGVYRTDVIVSSEPDGIKGETLNFVGMGNAVATLRVPSGELVIRSLYDLGEPNAITIGVTPGLYKVVLTVNWEQQEQHQFLEDVSEYPREDGPDYSLYLKKLDS